MANEISFHDEVVVAALAASAALAALAAPAALAEPKNLLKSCSHVAELKLINVGGSHGREIHNSSGSPEFESHYSWSQAFFFGLKPGIQAIKIIALVLKNTDC